MTHGASPWLAPLAGLLLGAAVALGIRASQTADAPDDASPGLDPFYAAWSPEELVAEYRALDRLFQEERERVVAGLFEAGSYVAYPARASATIAVPATGPSLVRSARLEDLGAGALEVRVVELRREDYPGLDLMDQELDRLHEALCGRGSRTCSHRCELESGFPQPEPDEEDL